ncbi:hypothetical protein M3T53_08945 [Actinomyces sp. B33]|uniref:hypothetical protein n=1 Tax=Actinomyces sp. B33 TaxID=2942131 RepID=UPI0023413915|nr:hypothetical protein [Actinomyces sp. B33]MDC4233825.1 hypothetical protein [Actinomyces sp. B33]
MSDDTTTSIRGARAGDVVEVDGVRYERIDAIEGDNWADEWRAVDSGESIGTADLERLSSAED